MTRKTTFLFGAFAAAAAVLWYIGPWPRPSPAALELPQETGPDAIYFHDQRGGKHPNGTLAVISGPGFVVVQEWIDGHAGALVGISDLLVAGRHENFSLTFERKMVGGEMLVATLYEDTDGDRVFIDGQDRPLQDAAEARVFVIFSVAP